MTYLGGHITHFWRQHICLNQNFYSLQVGRRCTCLWCCQNFWTYDGGKVTGSCGQGEQALQKSCQASIVASINHIISPSFYLHPAFFSTRGFPRVVKFCIGSLIAKKRLTTEKNWGTPIFLLFFKEKNGNCFELPEIVITLIEKMFYIIWPPPPTLRACG